MGAETVVIRNASFSRYYEIVTKPYSLPRCEGWTQAVLRLDGTVKGIQFDRFGAVWLSGVPVLRTTTPEPNTKGIVWQVLRDITCVKALLSVPGNMSVQIPNIVDATYTGIFYITVSIDFYKPDDVRLHASAPKIIRPLRQFSRLVPVGREWQCYPKQSDEELASKHGVCKT